MAAVAAASVPVTAKAATPNFFKNVPNMRLVLPTAPIREDIIPFLPSSGFVVSVPAAVGATSLVASNAASSREATSRERAC